MDHRPSLSALGAAFGRAYHSLHAQPKIFDDWLAARLFTDQELNGNGQQASLSLQMFDPEAAATKPDPETALALLMRTNAPIALSRARYAEDILEAGIPGFRQYVILGAGLDTFAFRRPELGRDLLVVELDHPATQTMKRERMARLGQPPQHLHLVPVDFATEDVGAALTRSPFDPALATFFSWLGVSYYLPKDRLQETLRSVAACARRGSAIVFDYFDPDAFDEARAVPRMRRMQEVFRRTPEPMTTSLDPASLGSELASLGWGLQENLGPSEIQARYFRERSDGYRAYEHVHFARASRL